MGVGMVHRWRLEFGIVVWVRVRVVLMHHRWWVRHALLLSSFDTSSIEQEGDADEDKDASDCSSHRAYEDAFSTTTIITVVLVAVSIRIVIAVTVPGSCTATRVA